MDDPHDDIYREARSHLEQAMALFDSADDRLAAARLSEVVEIVKSRLVADRGSH